MACIQRILVNWLGRLQTVSKVKSSTKGSYGKQAKGKGHGNCHQPYWQQQQQQPQYYWSERHSQWQRSYPGGYAGRGSSSSSSGYGSKGKQDRPWQETVKWNGAMYTKCTFRDGRVKWQAWYSPRVHCELLSHWAVDQMFECFFGNLISKLCITNFT